ncbi:MAG: hypothetical protein AAF387_18215, partial [Pseudomonadota bacterium]
ISGIEIAPGTALAVTQQNLLINDNFGAAASGTNIAEISSVGLLPLESRAPTSFTLNYKNGGLGLASSNVSLGANASITGGPNSEIALISDTRVLVDGRISAPGGTAILRIDRPGDETGFDPSYKIWLGENADIDVDGLIITTLSENGLRDARIVDAGSIFLDARRGYIVGHPQATLSANAVAGSVDVFSTSSGGLLPSIEVQEIYTNAGSIALSSPEGIFFAGQVAATATHLAGSEAGTLAVTLNNNLREAGDLAGLDLPFFPVTGDRIFISNTRAIPFFSPEEAIPRDLNGTTILRTQTLNNGFDNIVLSAVSEGTRAGLITTDETGAPIDDAFGALVFDHDASINVANRLTLDVSQISVLSGHAELNSAQLQIGPAEQDFRYDPVSNLGTGRFSAKADSVRVVGDLFFEDLAPTNSLSIAADNHLQLLGNSQGLEPTDLLGSIRSASDIDLAASVIYPGSFSQFLIKNDRAGGAVRFSRNGRNAPAVFSAVGALTVEADTIYQGGFLSAPFGSLSFDGGTVNLMNGSTSSVAANETILLGATQFGIDWIYNLFGQTLLFDETPAKGVSINADTINLLPGSEIDVSGGGDLLAVEFRPGPGGSIDITSADGNTNGSFAIIPDYGDQSLPFDPLISTGLDIALGDSVVISNNDLIEAGTYSVLPARFALLPGAYLLTPNETGVEVIPGTTNIDTAGRPLIVGKRGSAATSFTTALWSNFIVSDGAAVRNLAEYSESLASEFFTGNATLPIDNGALSLAATTALNLQGTILSNSVGKAPELDIVATQIDIVRDRSQAAVGAVALLDSDLANFSNGSVFLGATRTQSGNTTNLDVLSQEINVRQGANLAGVDFVFAATDNINVETNASILATGNLSNTALGNITIDGDAALLVVSQGNRGLLRSSPAGVTGSVATAAGSSLSADGQIIIDVTGRADLMGSLASEGGEIAIGAARISVGDVPGGTPGTILGDNVLTQLASANVSLRSSSTVDFFGGSNLTFGNFSVDAESIVGHLGVGETLNVNTDLLTFVNSGSEQIVTGGSGGISFISDRAVFSGGVTGFDGFGAVSINATNGVAFAGASGLVVGGDLQFASSSFSANTAGATLDIAAPNGQININRNVGEQPAGLVLGGRLGLDAQSVSFATDLLLPSGVFTATASAGNVDISGSSIDLSGQSIDFVEAILVSPGGRMSLQGTDVMLGNAAVNVGAPAEQGGSVELFADMTIDFGTASIRANGGGGSLFIDASEANGANVGAAIASFNAAGFNDALNVAFANETITLGETSSIAAREVSIVSGSQDVNLFGTVDTSAGKAGRIRAYAGGTLTVGANANLLAVSTDADEAGGSVELGGVVDVNVMSTTTGMDEVKSLFNVSGVGGAGTVLVRAPVVAGNNEISVSAFNANVVGANDIRFEAYRTFDESALANPLVSIKGQLDNVAPHIGDIEMR